MQHHHLILFGFGLAVLWAVCLLCRRHDPTDRESGTLIGQALAQADALHHQPPPPADSALVRVCGGCWTVLGTSPKTVFPGQHLQLSTHEACPKCAGYSDRRATEDAEFREPMTAPQPA